MYYFEEKMRLNDVFFFYRGRVALYAILKSIGIKEGDEVLLQAFTCVAVPNPIVCLGAVPVYVDIDLKTFTMDASKVEEKISSKTKAIIIQHTFGIPAEMDQILKIAKKYNLFVIEDCCHTFASTYKGKEIGTFGDAAFYSFEWGKPIIIGIGGCAFINNIKLKAKIESYYEGFVAPPLKEVGIINLQYFFHHLLLNPAMFWAIRDLYHFLSKQGLLVGTFRNEDLQGTINPDYQRRMPNLLKRRLLHKVKELDEIVSHSSWVSSQYEKLLTEAGIATLKADASSKLIILKYPVMVNDKENIISEARKERVELGSWYSTPIHPLTEMEWEQAAYKKGMCPIAEEAARKIILLPIHRKIKMENIRKAVSFLERNK